VTGQRFGRSLGWEQLHKGPLSAYKVPGNHDSILREPNVSEVAQIFCDHLFAGASSATSRRP
jgi:thioesterase domain-containing protein